MTGETMNAPKIALSSRYSRNADELLAFARSAHLDGIEYTIRAEDDNALEEEKDAMRTLASSEMEIRYHLQFFRVELAHRDRERAAASAAYVCRVLDFLHEIGGRTVIMHLCLGYRRDLEKAMSLSHAETFLSDVVRHAKSLNMEVCLENLTFGLVSTPEDFLHLLDVTGASATIDIGHAAASPCVLNGTISAPDYVRAVAPRLRSAHVYDIELPDPDTGKFIHHPPMSRECLEERINALKGTPCSWWLIELGNAQDILRTAAFLRDILHSWQDKDLPVQA